METIGHFVVFENSLHPQSSIARAMSDSNLWTAIAKTIIIIFLGFILTKKKIFPQGMGKMLTKVVMVVALPCLAFTGFMSDYTASQGIDAIFNLVFGFLIYILFIFLAKLIFIWVKDPTKKTVLCVLFSFGSAVFFSQPLIHAIFGTQAYKNSNMVNISFLVLLYSYAYVSISGIQLDWRSNPVAFKSSIKKIFLNPVVIAVLIGLLFWFLQAIPDSATIRKDWLSPNPNVSYAEASKVAFWRVDVTLPWFFQVATMLGSLSSPLVWLAIGCTLGNASIKEAATDKHVWIYSAIKVFLVPLFALCLLAIIQSVSKMLGNPSLVSLPTLQANVILWVAPPAAVVVAYCIDFDKEKELASNASIVSTLLSIPAIMVWVFVLASVSSFSFFSLSLIYPNPF